MFSVWLVLFIVGFLFSFFFTQIVIFAAKYLNLLDKPNHRSSHVSPTPKLGGVAIIMVFGGTMLFFLRRFPELEDSILTLAIPFLIVVGLSLLDDIWGLSAKFRFAIQISASLLVYDYGVGINHLDIPFLGDVSFGILSLPITLFWLVGMTNIYNFMDGVDGLAGGQALIASFFIFVFSYFTENLFLQVSSFSLFGATAGFLIFNFPPAKIFMGDVGSASIGFFFGVVAIQASQTEGEKIPFIIFIMLLGTFIFDTTVTLSRRIIKKEKWFAAHRSHFYQRLLVLNYTHFDVTVFELITAFILGGFTLLYYWVNDSVRLLLLLILLITFISFALAVTKMEKNIDSFMAKKLKRVLDIIHRFNRHPIIFDKIEH